MEEKVIPAELVAKHIVGVKDGNPYDFWVLYVRAGRVEQQLNFDFKNNKGDYQRKQFLLDKVLGD